MRVKVFAGRNQKELLRDPLSLIFCFGLPLFLLVLISFLQQRVAVDIFRIEAFAPGIVVFSFAFLTLFCGMLVGRDRTTSYLGRLFASPMTAPEYILGYLVPLVPLALLQSIVFFGTAMLFGLPWSVNILLAVVVCMPISLLFTALGLLMGSLLTDRQSGGVFTILAQVVAFTSGMWFDLGMIGGAFEAISYALPFAHAVDAVKLALAGNMAAVWPHLGWCMGYAVVIFAGAVLIFRRRMRN